MTARPSIATKSLHYLLALPLIYAVFCSAQDPTRIPKIGPSPQSRIVPPSPAYQYPNGQKFVYSVQWHMWNAGTATILMKRSATGEHLISTANSAGIADKFFAVHDTFEADLDSKTFCTQYVSKHSEEGSRRLDRRIQFDYSRRKSEVDDNDLKARKQKHTEFDIPTCVTDVVDGFFYVRSLPLELGSSQIFPVNDGGKTTDVRIQVEGHEQIKVPAGEYQTVRARAEPLSGAMQGKGVLWVWFTDDGRHVPVQMKSKLGFATLVFRLERIEQQPGTQ
jgi:hypothetical protein